MQIPDCSISESVTYSDLSVRLSVLIPCYGTASLVGRLLKSLVPLAGHGVEILMADDCSPDGVDKAIARALAADAEALAPYTRVLKNERNLGLASTRNRLFDEARGRYIAVVDSDDYVDAMPMLAALSEAESCDADIVAAPFFTTDGAEKVSRVAIPEDYDLNRLPVHVKSFSLCNKLIKRKFVADNGLRWFDGLNRWEDLGMTSRMYALAPDLKVVTDGWYRYVIDRGLSEKYSEFLTALKFYAKGGYLRKPVDIKAWRSTFPEAKASLTSPAAVPLLYRLAFMMLG